MGRSPGAGWPIFFHCPNYRALCWRTRTTRDADHHTVELTGRRKPTPRNGKGHPRKSWVTFEYECRCGHVGWSSHMDLARMGVRRNLATMEEVRGYRTKDEQQ